MSARLAPPDRGALDPEQEAVARLIEAGPRGRVAGPLAVWLHSPELARHAQGLGAHVRYDALPARLSELAILVAARVWGAGYEWAHHAPIALAEGWDEAAVDAIAHARVPALPDDASRAAFDCAVGLHRDRALSEATAARVLEVMGPRGTVDLVGLCGYYGLISMSILAFGVPRGEGPTLPALDLAVTDYFREPAG